MVLDRVCVYLGTGNAVDSTWTAPDEMAGVDADLDCGLVDVSYVGESD